MYHYTYRITNTITNKHYYGARSSKIHPKLDLGIKYFSSSTDKEFIKEQKLNKDIFKYKIVKIFNNRKDAFAFEVLLHNKFDVAANENFYNKAKQTSSSFQLSSEAISKNTKLQWETMDVEKHKKLVSEGNKRYWDNCSKEERKEYSIKALRRWENKTSIEKEKFSKMMSENNSGGKNGASKAINIFNSNGEVQFECFGNFMKVCKENNLPGAQLKNSYRTGGIPIYPSKFGQTQSKKFGWDKCIGWYATYKQK